MRIKIIAGNWKMNTAKEQGDFPEETYVQNLVSATTGIDGVEVSVFPPFTHLGLMFALAEDNFNVGVQDISENEKGAFTGDVSVDLALQTGANSGIVGHSERRSIHNESDALVNAKATALISGGLTAFICIGETESENEAGNTLSVIAKQFDESTPSTATPENTVIAYEPVWAIGTGKTPTTEDIQKIHSDLRGHIAKSRGNDFAESVRILYGGSVNPDNAKEILSLPDVDGALVGGASLNSDDFINIIKSA